MDMTHVNPEHFRGVLSHLPTGVSIVTAYTPDGPVGMAANSVTSVSLRPPLVLFCPARTSTTWPRIREAGSFCISVMAGNHAELTRRFAARSVDRFGGVEYVSRPAGPALSDALAWIECHLQDEHGAGDHTIAVAVVLALESAPELFDPLVFFRGAYGSFRESGSG
jgi:3-hydroxy-9,10-secoandrosta-1,3,5(10)-triene-9,17-dione monooxygenase reductase component